MRDITDSTASKGDILIFHTLIYSRFIINIIYLKGYILWKIQLYPNSCQRDLDIMT